MSVAGAAGPGAGAARPVDLVVAHVAGELHIPLSCGKLYIFVPGLYVCMKLHLVL